MSSQFQQDVISGLSNQEKSLPFKYFYDDIGSKLFNEICKTPEYYVTRTETSILRSSAHEIANEIGQPITLIDYGSGSGEKTQILLRNIAGITNYIPVDISLEQLEETSRKIKKQFPAVSVFPQHNDFFDKIVVPRENVSGRLVAFFPGSTIGNLEPSLAIELLKKMRKTCGPDGIAIVGYDLDKNANVLIAAYNDRQGKTADFNLNILARINRELNGKIDLNSFSHVAEYDETRKRISMHLESKRDQLIEFGEHKIPIKAGERIFTESSYKFSVDSFGLLASKANWNSKVTFLDDQKHFAVTVLD